MSPKQAKLDTMFSRQSFKAILHRALSENPLDRPANAIELLSELTGKRAYNKAQENISHPVVISYSRSDEKEAEWLIDELRTRGISAWRDKDMIPGGVQWRKAIVSAIENCRVVLFLVSKASVESSQVPKELDIATEANKTILPVCLEDVEIHGDLRYILAGLQRLDFFNSDRENSVNRLIKTLSSLGVKVGLPGSV